MCVSVLDVVDQIVYYPYMPSIVGKKRGNQTYYYLVESARVNGKPRPLAHPRPRCCRDPAMAANRTQDTTFLGARYRRLARRIGKLKALVAIQPVSYTHLRAHETVLDLVCRLLLEKKKTKKTKTSQ